MSWLADAFTAGKAVEVPNIPEPDGAPAPAGFPDWADDLRGSVPAESIPGVLGLATLLSNSAASIRFRVTDAKGVRVTDSPLAKLLADPHRAGGSPWQWRADMAMSIAGRSECLLHVLRVGRRVVGFRIAPLGLCSPMLVDGGVGWQDTSTGRTVMIGRDDWILLRTGALSNPDGSFQGLQRGSSRTNALADVAFAESERQKHLADHARSGLAPAFAYEFPPTKTAAQAKEWVDTAEAKNSGRRKWGRILPVGGGAKIVPVPTQSSRDAQMAELTALVVAHAAWLWNIPPSVAGLEGAQSDTTGNDWRRFITLAVCPLLYPFASAAEQRYGQPGETVTLDTSALILDDPLVRAQVDHLHVQDGQRVVDELRVRDGLEPYPALPADGGASAPGSVPQITPVGGAPNAVGALPFASQNAGGRP